MPERTFADLAFSLPPAQSLAQSTLTRESAANHNPVTKRRKSPLRDKLRPFRHNRLRSSQLASNCAHAAHALMRHLNGHRTAGPKIAAAGAGGRKNKLAIKPLVQRFQPPAGGFFGLRAEKCLTSAPHICHSARPRSARFRLQTPGPRSGGPKAIFYQLRSERKEVYEVDASDRN